MNIRVVELSDVDDALIARVVWIFVACDGASCVKWIRMESTVRSEMPWIPRIVSRESLPGARSHGSVVYGSHLGGARLKLRC